MTGAAKKAIRNALGGRTEIHILLVICLQSAVQSAQVYATRLSSISVRLGHGCFVHKSVVLPSQTDDNEAFPRFGVIPRQVTNAN